MDKLIVDLKDRFNEKTIENCSLNTLIPNTLKMINDDSLINSLTTITERFGDLLGSPLVTQLMGEVQLYKQSSLPTDNALEALQNCDANYFPKINALNFFVRFQFLLRPQKEVFPLQGF